MSGVSNANRTKSISLAILMIMMAQAGYLEHVNSWKASEDTLDQTSNMPDNSDSALSSNSPAIDILNGYQLSAKGLHTCSILDNGSLMCWGLNNRGQIGIGNTLNALSPEWVDLGSGANVTEVANGYRHTCAILENGSIMCWGENLAGQMGNGQQYSDQTTPLWVDLGAGRTAVRIDADEQNTCAIADNGSLYCWGDNTQGMLNYDPLQLPRQTTPRWIDLGGNAASAVSVGSMNVCSLLNNGSLYCWGDDSYGQLARGSVLGPDSWVPLHVDFGAGVTVAQIDLGAQHLCAIVDNGSLYCWGRNSNGALGNGSGGFSQSTGTPSWVDLGTGRTAVAVSSGGFHTCAIVDNGSLYCWGLNSAGQLGIGNTVEAHTPQWVNLGVGRTAIAISAGHQHTCAILDNGEMKCWGSDYNGALGNGPGTSSYTIPVTIPGGFTWSTATGSNSGGSSSNNTLIPSVEGADLMVGEAMEDITFQYDASAASGSGTSVTTTYGNGSVWQVENIHDGSWGSYPGSTLEIVVGDTVYFDAVSSPTNPPSGTHYNSELWAYNTSNETTWQVANINTGNLGTSNEGGSYPGQEYEILVGDTIYFDAYDLNYGSEMWAHDTSNHSTWRVTDINPGTGQSSPGDDMNNPLLIGDTIVFVADEASGARSLWAHNTSNHTTWKLNDHPGGFNMMFSIGDTIYYDNAYGHILNGKELMAYNMVNNTAWNVVDIDVGGNGGDGVGKNMWHLIGDVLYFDAEDGSTGRELWAYDFTNKTAWQIHDASWGNGNPGQKFSVVIDETIYFSLLNSTYGTADLWAHDTSNGSTWCVEDFYANSNYYGLHQVVSVAGDTIYLSFHDGITGYELWAYDTSNYSTWQVTDINQNTGLGNAYPGGTTDSFTSTNVHSILVGDTIYFRATVTPSPYTYEMWAHDTSNQSTWRVTYINSSSTSSAADTMLVLVNDTIILDMIDGPNSNYGYDNGHELWAIQPGEITSLSSGSGSGSGGGSSSSSTFAYANNKLALGYQHTCAILDTGDMKCWGGNVEGQLGDGSTTSTWGNVPTTPIDLGTGRTAVAISAGYSHTCAILDTGEAKCWGSNNYGQLGDGSTVATNTPSSTAIDLGTGRTAVAISAGDYHTCAILDNGEAKCWGRDNQGQLGDGGSNTDTNAPSSTAIDLGTGRTAVAISAGTEHTCAILDTGDLKCWGTDNNGQLGDGGSNTATGQPSSTAINLGTNRTAVAVSTGTYHTCAILDNGDLKCWGRNYFKQTGYSSQSNILEPRTDAVDLGSGRTVVAMSAGSAHTCAILDNGSAKCWGQSTYGQLGYPTGCNNGCYGFTVGPIDLGTGRTPVAVDTSAGSSDARTCVILDNGEAKCWGSNGGGSLGNTSSSAPQMVPILVSGNNTWDSSTTASSGSSGGMTNVTGATCSISPALPTGLNIDTSTCTISGTPSVATSNTTYTVTADISGTTYQGTVWLSSSYPQLTPSVEGAELETGQAMTDVTFNAPLPPANGTFETIFEGGLNAKIGNLEADIDSNDVTHAVFFDPDSSSLIYANDASGTWSSEVLATGESQYDPSMVIDSNDKIHISYLNYTNKEVMYANNVAGSWVSSIAADFNDYWSLNEHYTTSIDVDSNNNAYIAYVYNYGKSTAKLEIADNSGGTWSSTILQEEYSGYHLSTTWFDLILDSNDAAHLLYTMRSGSNYKMNHTTDVSGSWVSTQIGSTVNSAIRYVSLNIDSTDVVHSIHQNGNYGRLIYSNNSGGTWTSTSSSTFPCDINFAHGTNSCGALSSIFIDADDNIHISHQKSNHRHLLYVNNVSGSWQTAQYNNPGPTASTGYGYETAVVVDSNGDVEILHGFELNSQMSLVSLFQQGLDSGSGSGSGSGVEYSSPITTATSCIATPSLPSGLNIDSSTCTISGTPAADSANTTYTITAVIDGNTYEASIWLSTFTFGEITSTVEGATLQLGETMTPITLNYTSQDGHQTAPVNVTGNGSVWWDNQDIFCDCGEHMAIVHGNTIYMDGVASGSAGHELYAYSIDTGMSWLVADINSNGDSVPGERMSVLIGDTIIFDADDGVHDRELWAHNVLTNTTWLVKDINPNANQLSFIGGNFAEVMNGVLYFDAYEPVNNVEIWGFNPQNGTSWNVTDNFSSMNQDQPGQKMIQVVGDTLYFSGREDTGWPYPAGTELWAYTATNQTTWLAADINLGSSASYPGEDFSVVIGDTIYFDAKITTGANLADRKIIAYDTSNHTHWVVTDVDQSDTLSYRDYNQMEYIGVVGSTIYTIGTNYIGMGPTGNNYQSRQIWAINTENETAWQVPNFPCLYNSGCVFPVNNMRLIVNDVIYFGFDDDSNAEELWAYNTTNETAWMITDLPGNPFTGFNPGEYMSLLVGDTIYFSAEAHDNSFQQGGYPGLGIASAGHLWAYDTSNESLYFFSNHYTDMPTHPTDTGTWNCNLIISHGVSPGKRFSFVIDDVLYYDIGADWSQSTSYNGNCPMPRVAGYQPSVITYSNYTPPVSWETEPPLPAGMSISGGTISGTPSVYASNQTYTIYANQSGYSTTHELYFSVDNAYPHTVVEDQPIDAIGFHPAFFDGTTTWSISPSLPNSLVQDTATGEITGTVDDAISSTYTVTATHSSGASETFTFSIDSLLDTDGDGLPNELPLTYNPANPPTSGLIADDDDDGDGLLDVVETGTGIYVDGQDTGTDPLDPDTDGDGICDGPNAVSGVCIAGPDADPNGLLPPPTLVGLNNTDIGTLSPYLSVVGGTFEISPELPNSLSMDPNTGEITGTPTETMANTTFTVWSNHSDGTSLTYDFTIEILEDSDGDGLPNKLPDDYDSSNPTSPGLIEDLDDDADGIPDTNETDTGSYVDESDTGTSPTNPDSDGDGMCDGPNAVSSVCTAGPDAFPLDPAGDTDTDGDGKPDVLKPGVDSTSVPPLEEDLDDDGDGWEDVNETGTNVYVDETDTGTDSLNPDTDGDGICDGPLAVPGICGAGPDDRPFGEPFDGQVYGVNNSFFPSLMPEVILQPGSTWEVHPDLPEGLEIDPVTGRITGVPTESMANTTFTVYGNGSDGVNVEYQFSMEILDDYDGDGVPNDLPDDYPVNGTLIEDNDDDNDGIPDEYETGTGVYVNGTDLGTDALNPDTDGDGMCDGPVAIENVCDAGPDAFPIDPAGDTDTDGDGKPDVLKPNVDSTSTPALEEDLDDDGDNVPDIDEDAAGTDSLLPDTDGDTICDGDIAVGSVCEAGPDAFPLDPSASVDTDDDGHPDEWNDGKDGSDSTSTPPLQLDNDDDNDTWADTDELACSTNPLDKDDVPEDQDQDGICDLLDVTDDSPISMVYNSTTLELLVGQEMTPFAPTTSGGDIITWEISGQLPEGLTFGVTPARSTGLDGVIRGNPQSAIAETLFTVWANNSQYSQEFAFTLVVYQDTDLDGFADQLPSDYIGIFQEDLDDDNDGWNDTDEGDCGSDPLDASSKPSDTDGDGICDALDDEQNAVSAETPEGGSSSSSFLSMWMWCCLLLLLLLLLIPLLFMDQVRAILYQGPEPEHTVFKPEVEEGMGTMDNPFILKSIEDVEPGTIVFSEEKIDISEITPHLNIDIIDLNMEENDQRFMMRDRRASEEGIRMITANPEGKISIRLVMDDSVEPTKDGRTYTSLLKLGIATVYFQWSVTFKADEAYLAEQQAKLEAEEALEEAKLKEEEEAKKKAEEEAAAAALLAKEAEEKAAKEAKKKEEAEAKKKAKEEADAKKKADAEANAAKEAEEAEAKKKAKEEADAKKKADAEAKAAKEAEEAEAKKAKEEAAAKKAKEAEAKKKAEEEAAAKKAKEEAAAKKKADAEAKAAKEAEEAEAKKKAEEEAAAKKAKEVEAKKKAKKPATAKEAKKQEELQRVKERAKSIDFKVIGKASSTELKNEVKKGAKTLEVADASKFADSGSAQITDEDGSSVIAWTGKDGNVLTGVSGVERVFGAASIVIVKDDLQVIKGIGPFIEEKLNALGITTYRQLANMNAKLEEQVNEAIEFFPGRVKRDQWVVQAKILLGEDAKLDEKALKQAEELERVAKKAEKIDFATIGTASASDRDNLQELKGIGPFIEEKLNALGIFKFEQIAKMTSKIEDEVNIAIEFFPGRVKRDQWVAQAKIRIGQEAQLDEKELKKAEELERVAKKAEKIDFGTIGVASATDKDNLQEMKGIGPFIEEKLNALGIFKFEQIAKMTSKIEEEVNQAIEFFPGRVKRDEWVKQAKNLAKK